jgi:hypothetical protein
LRDITYFATGFTYKSDRDAYIEYHLANNWHPIYPDSSIPFLHGQRFLLKRNSCICLTEEPKKISCRKTRPCVYIVQTNVVYAFKCESQSIGNWGVFLKTTYKRDEDQSVLNGPSIITYNSFFKML